MSAGICIMNKHAVAMAADSAVTIGQHVAIHNSANKLFALSRCEPVGVIYGDPFCQDSFLINLSLGGKRTFL